MSNHVTIVEDDPDVRAILERSLTASGYAVTALASGAEIDRVLSDTPTNLLILDIGLPGVDGLTITQQVRRYSDVGIIILSGHGDLTDRVVGLEVGADDYMTKPFEPREVIARVRSVLRRGARSRSSAPEAAPDHETFTFGEWTLDLPARRVSDVDGCCPALTTGEFKLLEAFVRHPNRVLTRDQLLDFCYGHNAPAFDRSVDVCIVRLRKKLRDNARDPEIIKTVRNGGYVFVPRVKKSGSRPQPALADARLQ